MRHSIIIIMAQNHLVHFYAACLHKYIDRVAEKHCSGCKIGHPSQLQHDICLLMDWEEKVDSFFDEAFMLLKAENPYMNAVFDEALMLLKAENPNMNAAVDKELKEKISIELKRGYDEVD